MRSITPDLYRPYQVAARDLTYSAFDEGDDSALVVMPTGTGKTVLAGMFVEHAAGLRGWRSLFIAHRETLIRQAYSTMTAFGFDAAVEMADEDARRHDLICGDSTVVVGSIQTMQDDRLMRWAPDHFGQIIIDECHRALTPMYTKMLNWFRDYKLVGITATPKRGDARNLGSRFRRKTFDYPLRTAIAEGWLVRVLTQECRVPIDLRGLKLHGGDFSDGELAERIGPKLEAIARGFRRDIGRRPAVAFLPDVGSAMAFAQVLTDLGTPARYVAGTGGAFGMSKAERRANFEAFDRDEFQVIVCCELLIEGWDCPKIEAVGIIRPTLQQYRYTQMVGRGTRPCPATGKKDCLVLDFDWETDPDAKDLCSTVDLFDDGLLDEEVYAVAKEIAKAQAEAGEAVDGADVIDQAEEIVHIRRKFLIKLTGKEVEYQSVTYDPVGVAKILDVTLNRKYDFDRHGANPVSPAQLGMLRSLGCFDGEKLSLWGASKLITKLKKRRDQGLADAGQVRSLLSSGVHEDLARTMSSREAAETIRVLEPATTKRQGSLFA